MRLINKQQKSILLIIFKLHLQSSDYSEINNGLGQLF